MTNSSGANVNGKTESTIVSQNATKRPCVAANDVGVCGSRLFPVVEAEDTIPLGSSAPEEEERKHQESDQGDDFSLGEPKFRFLRRSGQP